ncbi:MAG TPA: FAD-dependent oxidoreductase [Acidimicrobiales bacterium]|nr:FAD-dependent oxidoreductase [Acidimicrobiales bacterium]
MRAVIIGGVAGGMSAATRLRRLDNEAEIVVLERSHHVSYANCGLPYYLGGVIEDERALLLETPQSLHDRYRLDVRVDNEAVAIDVETQSVVVKNLGSDETYALSYDVLILSPGASPVIPAIPGIERALPLRTVEDVQRMANAAQWSPTSAVVIGGGFIGVEVAENLVRRGIATTIIEAAAQVLAPLDPEMAAPVADELRRHGVSLYLGDSVESVTSKDVRLSSGEVVPAELLVVAIGVRPDTDLARAAGLTLGDRGGVVVDEHNQSSAENVYVIGDAVEKADFLDGAGTLLPLANLASRQGRVVADHIAGRIVRPRATIGTAIVKVFDLTVAMTGWNEKRLASQDRAFLAIHTHPASHATYYPGAKTMALKLLVDPDSGAILGAQGVGAEGVDKRIDVLATAIRAGLTAPELADLELAYAPPFGSAKDPVNMLGYIAENLLSGLIETVQWSEVDDYRVRGAQFVDVRTAAEFSRGSLPGAVNIPIDELRERYRELDVVETVVTCEVGQRGHTATLLLNELGIRALNLDGGVKTWQSSPASVSPQLVG